MKSLPTPDTSESWDAASRGYAEKVAPVMMQAYADELAWIPTRGYRPNTMGVLSKDETEMLLAEPGDG